MQPILLWCSCLWSFLLWRRYAPLLYQTIESFRMPDGAWCLFKIFCLHCAIFCTVISVLYSTFESWIWRFVYLISSALKVGIGHNLRSACVCQKLKTGTEMQRSSCVCVSICFRSTQEVTTDRENNANPKTPPVQSWILRWQYLHSLVVVQNKRNAYSTMVVRHEEAGRRLA